MSEVREDQSWNEPSYANGRARDSPKKLSQNNSKEIRLELIKSQGKSHHLYISYF